MAVEVLSRPGALPALLALARAHPEPLSATAFVRAAGMTNKGAQALRGHLAEAGLLAAAVADERGAVRTLEVTLTPLGRRVAQHVLRMETALRGART